MPGFEAHSGCEVYIYNDGCTSTYYRTASNMDTSNIELIHKIQAAEFADVHIKLPAAAEPGQVNSNPNDNESSSEEEITSNITGRIQAPVIIIPNPSAGVFIIQFHSENEMPLRLAVLDGTGRVIHEAEYAGVNNYVLDLRTHPDGIYALKINYQDKVIAKTLVKSGNN